MKDLSTIIKKGELSAKERALIYISSQIESDKSGKELLTAKDIEAIKDSKAFTSNEYINTYNSYVKSWTCVVLLNTELSFLYSGLVFLYNHIRDLCFFTAKDVSDTYLLNTCIKELDDKNEYSLTILTELQKQNNPLKELGKKNNIKDVELTGHAKESLNRALKEYRSVYSVILTNRDILLKVSQKLGVDVAYKVNQYHELAQSKATSYDSLIDFMLIDFSNSKSKDLKSSPRDKKFKNREEIYLDLDKVSLDQEIFNSNISHFENFFGKRFWEC